MHVSLCHVRVRNSEFGVVAADRFVSGLQGKGKGGFGKAVLWWIFHIKKDGTINSKL